MEKYTVKTIRKINSDLINQWGELWKKAENANVFNSYEWFLASLDSVDQREFELHACYMGEELVAIMPLFFRRHFGIKVATQASSEYSVDTPFLILRYDPEIYEIFFKRLISRKNLLLIKIDDRSTEILSKIFPKMFFTLMSVNPYIELSGNPLRFISKSNLKEIKRVMRKNVDDLEFKTYDSKSNLNEHLETIFNIDIHSGKKQQSKDVFSKKEVREFYKTIVRHCSSFVRISFLYYKKVPISYIFSFSFKKTFLDYQTSYLNDYRKYSPGKTIIVYLLEQLKGTDVELFDFCGGVSAYKQEFTPEFYFQYNLYYSRNPLIMFWWKGINLARRIKQILLPEKYSRDGEFLFKVYKRKNTRKISRKNIVNATKRQVTRLKKVLSVIIPLVPGAFTFVFCAAILFLSVRGLPGNPSAGELAQQAWREEGPFNLSPERGRFALTYSIVEDLSYSYSVPIAQFATPDLGYINGKYVSLFAPTVSFIVIPGYIVGKALGASQFGAFTVIALFAVLNALLVQTIALRLGSKKFAAISAGLMFLFATPAFAYGTSLYQHHISLFLILLSLYAILRWNNFWSLSLVWLLCALSISVDNPNLFLMFPIGLASLGRLINIKVKSGRKSSLEIKTKPLYYLSFAAMVLPVLFFLAFNKQSYGNPFQLSGTVPSVKAVDEEGKPVVPETVTLTDLDDEKYFINPELQLQDKSALGFFDTRKLLNGFYINLLSPDRGVLYFSPVLVISFVGMYFMYRENKEWFRLLLSVFAINLLLYSMWGDPWGGWAFGARYLIPGYGILAIFVAEALTKFKPRNLLLVGFTMLFAYSAYVNTAGALTSLANPPKVEVLYLEQQTGTVQKYTYERNIDQIHSGVLKSFVYRSVFEEKYDAKFYFYAVYALILIPVIVLTSSAVSINTKRIKELTLALSLKKPRIKFRIKT